MNKEKIDEQAIKLCKEIFDTSNYKSQIKKDLEFPSIELKIVNLITEASKISNWKESKHLYLFFRVYYKLYSVRKFPSELFSKLVRKFNAKDDFIKYSSLELKVHESDIMFLKSLIS